MVTHDPRFAKHAQREVHLFDGKVVAEEELKKLLQETSAGVGCCRIFAMRSGNCARVLASR
jgi:hypothetical protein